MFFPNRVYTCDAVKAMQKMDAESVDMTLTSPPYDKLRTYNTQLPFAYEPIIEGLYRVTKNNGVVVWVVADMLHNGGESGTSFKQALRFIQTGFKLHDTMIFQKQNPMPRKQRRYTQQFEYMFVFTKGTPKTFNPITEPSKYAGVKSTGRFYEKPNTTTPFRTNTELKHISQTKIKGNIWKYWVDNNKLLKHVPYSSGANSKHPAKMTLLLAIDHIKSWSNPGDLIFDPMCGCGTTLVAAKYLERNYIGVDISSQYAFDAKTRIKNATKEFPQLKEVLEKPPA